MRQEQGGIIGGAEIKNYDRSRKHLGRDDFYMFCDGGLKHMAPLCLTPDLIIGDFDSWKGPRPDAETIVLPREKDDTDTVYAIKEAMKRGFETFLLIGAAGERLDHTLVNVYALLMLDSAGKRARLIDDYSEMEIVSKSPAYIPDSFPYFSLLNISGTAKGITIENARFPLENGEISSEYQYATSNEVLPGKTAKVEIRTGKLLLIKCFAEK